MKRLAGAVMVFLVCLAGQAAAEEIRIAGGGGPVENVLKPVKAAFEKATGITLNIVPSGATNAFKELEKGTVDASSAGFGFDELLATLKKDGHGVADPAAYQHMVMGKGKIYVIVQKDNAVQKLTKEQAKGIFTGKIGNWKEVGGKDMPIIVVLAKLNPATNNAFLKAMLDDAPYPKDVLYATTSEDLRLNIASNPEAVGFGPVTIIDQSVKSLETPEVSRPLILVTKGAPSPKVQKFIDFIRGEGKKYIKE